MGCTGNNEKGLAKIGKIAVLYKLLYLGVKIKRGEKMVFSDEDNKKVWEKGTVVRGYDKKKWRKDHCGAWIYRSSYGKTGSRTNYGWQIDHIDHDTSNNSLSNLRPLQWANNNDRGDGNVKCYVTSKGNKNVDNKPKA